MKTIDIRLPFVAHFYLPALALLAAYARLEDSSGAWLALKILFSAMLLPILVFVLCGGWSLRYLRERGAQMNPPQPLGRTLRLWSSQLYLWAPLGAVFVWSEAEGFFLAWACLIVGTIANVLVTREIARYEGPAVRAVHQTAENHS